MGDERRGPTDFLREVEGARDAVAKRQTALAQDLRADRLQTLRTDVQCPQRLSLSELNDLAHQAADGIRSSETSAFQYATPTLRLFFGMYFRRLTSITSVEPFLTALKMHLFRVFDD